MPTFSDITLAMTVLLSSVITMLCSTPPSAAPKQAWKQDRLGTYASPRAASLRRAVAVGMGLHHAVLVCTDLGDSSSGLICRRPENLNSVLFGWNPHTSLCLSLIICVGGPLRLAAFARLGQNFTFRLGPPDRLTTTGIYRYTQHPSYTGQVVVLFSNLALLLRWDGAVGCWIPLAVHSMLRGWGFVTVGILMFGMLRKLVLRVKYEEIVLREAFGAEWVKWHETTNRFVPLVI